MRVILSAKAVWATTKDPKVAEKVRTASIIVRKSRVDMDICCGDGTDVLCPTDAVGTKDTRSAKDADDLDNGVMTTGATDGTI